MVLGLRVISSAVAALMLGIGASTAVVAAEKFPSKPIRVLVPFAPGGATDIVMRIVGSGMEPLLGQPVVIENKPGAFGILAMEEMGRSEPDGYTLQVGISSTNVIAPLFHKSKMKLNYDEAIVTVGRLAEVPNLFAVTTKDFAPRTFKDFVAHAKANPGKVRYGSTGFASFVHFDTISVAKAVGIEMVHVPATAGASGIVQALTNGDVQVSIINVATSGPLIEAGRIHPIAIASGERIAKFPDIPTFKELGIPDANSALWVALYAPAKTPDAVLNKLNDAVNKALATETVKAALAKQHFTTVPTASIADAKKWTAEERALWERKIAGSGLKPN